MSRLDDEGGGIILYLEQEGRGLGLANKMRAYKLQDDGLDTLDANTMLGFDDDERDYGIAVRMLQILGCTRVKLLTNNPAKLDWLTKAGIEVCGRIPLHGPVNADNRRYLTAKAMRAGHKLDHLMSAPLAEPAETPVEPVERQPGRIEIDAGAGKGRHGEIRTSTGRLRPATRSTARVLHWVIAVLVLLMIPVGIIIANEWGGPAQKFLYNLHKSIGATLIPLVIIRLLYRLTHPAPPLPSDIPGDPAISRPSDTLGAIRADPGAADRRLHHDVGLSGAGAVLRPVQSAGDLAGGPRAVGAVFRSCTCISDIAIAVVAAMHIGAALYHHFVRKDHILMRMISG